MSLFFQVISPIQRHFQFYWNCGMYFSILQTCIIIIELGLHIIHGSYWEILNSVKCSNHSRAKQIVIHTVFHLLLTNRRPALLIGRLHMCLINMAYQHQHVAALRRENSYNQEQYLKSQLSLIKVECSTWISLNLTYGCWQASRWSTQHLLIVEKSNLSCKKYREQSEAWGSVRGVTDTQFRKWLRVVQEDWVSSYVLSKY